MSVAPTVTPIRAAQPKPACANCTLRELCLPVGFSDSDVDRLEAVITARHAVPRGDALFRHGDRFEALYALRSGFFKTLARTPDRRGQVVGFQMPGELMGLDGIGSGQHRCDAVALEDSQVCIIPYEGLEKLSRDFAGLQRQVHRIMSREIVREQGAMVLLGGMRAEERLASFLLNLCERSGAPGVPASTLVLRMTREELGTYLGLTIETVSRCFSKLHDDSVLAVKQRTIRILDRAALGRLVHGERDAAIRGAAAAIP